MRNITTEELKALQEKNAGLTLVNTLKRDAFEKTKIPNSVNIPLESEDFVACVEKAAGCKTSQVVVYCANSTCDASEVAAKKLEEAGFTDVLAIPVVPRRGKEKPVQPPPVSLASSLPWKCK